MLLDPHDWALASRIDDVLPALSPRRSPSTRRAETHGSALELFSRPAPDRRAARRPSSRDLRAGLAADLAPLGLRAAVAGTHPFAQWSDVEVSPGARYQSIYDSMRELARREPTFALHVHVAVPDAEAAVRALRGLRVHVPLLLALAANSPFWQGRDTGLAVGARADLRHVPARRHPAAVRRLRRVRRGDRRAAALRRVPRADVPVVGRAAAAASSGTIEVRIMDAQTRAADNAALAALVQCARAARGDRGLRRRGDRRAGPRCSTRTASSPRATGCGPSSSTRERDGRRPARDILDELLAALRAARRRARLRGRAGRGARARRRARRPPPAAAGRRAPGRHGRARARRPGRRAGGRLQRRAGGAGRRLARPVTAAGPRARAGCARSPGGGRRATSAGGGPGPARRGSQLVGDEVVGDLGERARAAGSGGPCCSPWKRRNHGSREQPARM